MFDGQHLQDTLLDKHEGLKRLYEGKAIDSPRGKIIIGKYISSGNEGAVFDCTPEVETEYPLVIKIHYSGSGMSEEDFDGSINIAMLHTSDDPPVIPRYFTMVSIDGRRAYIMEKISDKSIIERIENESFSEEETLRASLPLMDFLNDATKYGLACVDLKLQDVRVGEWKGHPYFRLIDFGTKQRESTVEQMIQNGRGKFIGMIVKAITGDSTLTTQIHLLSDRRNSEREKKVALHDLVNDYFFKKLSLGLQYILIQVLSGTTEKYPDLRSLHNDLVALLICETCRKKETALERCNELSPDIQPYVLYMINLRFDQSKDPKKNQESKSQLLQQISALAPDPGPVPAESPEEKEYRLKDARARIGDNLPAYILYASIPDSINETLLELDQYFPNDPLIKALRKAVETAKAFNAVDEKHDNYLSKRLYEDAAGLLVHRSEDGNGLTFVSLEEMDRNIDKFRFSVATLLHMASTTKERPLNDQSIIEEAVKMLKKYIKDQQELLANARSDREKSDLRIEILDAINLAKACGLGDQFATEEQSRSV